MEKSITNGSNILKCSRNLIIILSYSVSFSNIFLSTINIGSNLLNSPNFSHILSQLYKEILKVMIFGINIFEIVNLCILNKIGRSIKEN